MIHPVFYLKWIVGEIEFFEFSEITKFAEFTPILKNSKLAIELGFAGNKIIIKFYPVCVRNQFDFKTKITKMSSNNCYLAECFYNCNCVFNFNRNIPK